MMIWPVSIDLPSSFSSFGRRNSIRQNDVQIGMTIVRCKIRCLVSKNEAVIIVIEDECCFSAEVLKRGLRTFITSNVIWIKNRFPLFVITCSYTTWCPWCSSATLFGATPSTFVELTIGNCGANHGGQTCPKHPESIINSCSSAHSDRSSQFTVYRRFLLSSSENIQRPSQSCSDEINLAVARSCLNLDSNHRWNLYRFYVRFTRATQRHANIRCFSVFEITRFLHLLKSNQTCWRVAPRPHVNEGCSNVDCSFWRSRMDLAGARREPCMWNDRSAREQSPRMQDQEALAGNGHRHGACG